MPNDWSQKKPTTPLYADLSPGGSGAGQSIVEVCRFNFCCTATDITATLTASMTLPAMPTITPAKDLPACTINVKPPLVRLRWHGRLTTPFMVQRRLTRTNVPRLGPCLAALRVLAKSNDPHRSVSVERHIDEYLRNDPFSLAHALERLRRAIHYEELERREGEDWSVARDYVRSLLHRMV